MALLFSLLLLAVAPASAVALPMADQATSFDVTFEVAEDGSVLVTERITWEFPGDEARRGIERLVTTSVGYQESDEVYRRYRISDITASSPTGAPDDVGVTDFGATTRIRVGDPNRTVSGTQDYVVSYRLAKVVNDIGDGTAELYYNLIAPSNNSVYQGIRASVTGPAPATRTACFVGELGATEECTHETGAISTFSSPDVGPGEGVTIVLSFPREAFGDLTPDLVPYDSTDGFGPDSQSSLPPATQRALGGLLVGAGVLLPVGAAALMGALVHTRGRDEWYAGLTPGLTPGHGEDAPVRRGGTPSVVVQFHPPEGVQPGLVGTIVDEQADTVDVSATIVDLAVRGFLKIEEVQKGGLFGRDDWELTWLTPPPDAKPLTAYENALMDGIFASGSPVRLSALREKFRPTLDLVQRRMYSEVVDRGWFRRSPDVMRQSWQSLGAVMCGGAILLGFLAFGPIARLLDNTGLPFPPFLALVVGLFIAGLIVIALGRRMASRTADGSAVLAQSLGFRRYMETAEANQIRWEEAEQIFSRFLPYAIVFGIAEKWATTFEEVAQAAAAAGHSVVLPTWYIGSGSYGSMASSMNDFSTVAAGTFASTPGSSGGSGFSSGGFGGGGFSGGGGGGASGGSW
ncbi:DUF2207 domain-containing protein [Nostocoides sp. F2B08]|nr:DUF2207 domain-containing protein [Tetrasphaera sp. F2B08]